jgi:hypothetical protein
LLTDRQIITGGKILFKVIGFYWEGVLSLSYSKTMKKGIASILLLLYIAFSSGVVISFHYCMDRFDSAQLGASEFDVCGKCGMHTEDGNACCNDEVRIFKIQDDQQSSAVNFKFAAPDAMVITLPDLYRITYTNSTHQLFSQSHSPPLNSQDTYLQNCVFRI